MGLRHRNGIEFARAIHFAPLGGALIAAYGWHDALLVLSAATL